MNAVAEITPTEIAQSILLAACEYVVDKSAEISALYDKIEALREDQQRAIGVIDRWVASDMRERSQQSKTIGGYRIRTGLEAQRVCLAHGAYVESCDCTGHVEIVTVNPRPFVRVSVAKGAE